MHVQEGIDTRIVMDQKGWYYPVGGNDYHPVDQGPRGRWTPISGDKGFIGRGITPGEVCMVTGWSQVSGL